MLILETSKFCFGAESEFLVSNDKELLQWLKVPRIPTVPYGEVVEILHGMSQRTQFLKQLPRNAAVLDAGAGDGSLERFRLWLRPDRRDIRMYAYAAERGERFGFYDGYETGFWPQTLPIFDGLMFDAIIACHFIEHLPDPAGFLQWAVSRLKSGGRIYLEWPSPFSLELPPLALFREAGIPLVISNFRDDSTHRDLPAAAAMIQALEQAGAKIEQQGIIRYPWLEEELLAHWQGGGADIYALQAAYWSRTRWSQFLTSSK
jgi:SAM-dependent methyltransferase